VEYGYVDDRLYCNCGACRYDQWEFKCKDPRHGFAWERYDNDTLMNFLKALEPFEELNILILGETGVGKSTWINAFINYLTYHSLDDALRAEDLRWVIPCSFSTQLKDESDSRGKFVQRDIKIGSSTSEKDGARGSSATQETSVYVVDIRNTRVRLIDTPGIGDTRGVEQDNKNMADILKVLRSYNKLHGILILLKPNAPRLTVMFRFCIKQLLTHLHRNAANNIVFGFTNTRGSNYKPGDTFKPLEALLLEYKEAEMGLFEHNVYCFDSESFRYLAARKKGVDMGLLEDNARSWEYSVAECKRLVKYFQRLKPHEVRSTINLNETRNIVLRLTEPMALIAQKIQSSIEVNDEQVKELQKKRFNRSQLEQKLHVQKESVESYEVDQPRTACTHHDCVEVRGDFGGREEMVVIYKTMCHKPCYLSGVDRNEKGHSDLQYCVAMDQSGFCRKCTHNWMDHMHIYYEYRPMTYKYRDEGVDRDLIANATDIELQEEAVRMKKAAIAEFELEHRQVQEAGIQFGFFLKRHAITPYNDATLEYLDHLIDQEKMKIQSGGAKKGLKALEKYKRGHLEKVQMLEKAMEEGDGREVLDDQGVHQLIDSLYGLPNFGKDLKRIVKTNEKAVEAAYRERSYNVSAGTHWYRQSTGNNKQDESWQRKNYTYQARPPSYYSDPYQEAIPGSFPRTFSNGFLGTFPDRDQLSMRPNEQPPASSSRRFQGSSTNAMPKKSWWGFFRNSLG
jgi:GTPase SAR1 family protein